MSAMTPHPQERAAPPWGGQHFDPYSLAAWERRAANNSGLLIAGLAALGVGVFAWMYLGPELRRYLKIREM